MTYDLMGDFLIGRWDVKGWEPGLALVRTDLARRLPRCSEAADGIALRPSGRFAALGKEKADWIFREAVRTSNDLAAFYRIDGDWDESIALLCCIRARTVKRLHRKLGGAAAVLRLARDCGFRRPLGRDDPLFGRVLPWAPALLAGNPHLREYRFEKNGHATTVPAYEPDLLSPPQKAAADLFAKVAKGTMLPFLFRQGRGG